jgi:lipoate-protein ligase A
MHFLDLTLESPEENLALDEALFEVCEQEGKPSLRFWEPTGVFVVLGYTNRARREVHLQRCVSLGIPVLRRLTGGGTVVQAPGVLNCTVVLPITPSGPLSTISGTNRFVLDRHQVALQGLVDGSLSREGDTDLALDGRKVSGNAQRRGRRAIIFHGTFLLALDTRLLEDLLPMPSREPDYRNGRPHEAFITNLGVDAAAVKDAVQREWQASDDNWSIGLEHIEGLVRQRYGNPSWNLRR